MDASKSNIFNATVQRFVKRLLLRLDDLLDMRLFLADFGKNIAHSFSEDIHQFVKERLVETESAPVADGAAQNAAQDVIAVLVGGQNAIGDGKTERADMIRDYPERHVYFFLIGLGNRNGCFMGSATVPVALPCVSRGSLRRRDTGI